jgi:hypothetical protein
VSTGAKGVLLAVVTYITTMSLALIIAVLAIIILMMKTANCTEMGHALLLLWATIAVVCIASVFVYVALARKYVSGFSYLNFTAFAYAAALLPSYFVIAFGLMVLFNC